MRIQSQHIFALLAAAVPSVAAGAEGKRDMTECKDVLYDMSTAIKTIPTPDAALEEFISGDQFADATTPCAIPTATGELAAEYTSYMSSISSWRMENIEGLSSFLEACTDVPELDSIFDQIPGGPTVCEEIVWETPSASDDNDGDDDDEGAAPRATGASITVVAIAAFVAAVL